MNIVLKTTIAAAVLVLTGSGAWAGALENMERERAIMLDTLLSGDIAAGERRSRGAVSSARLIDLERMVLRDKSLVGKNTPLVRAAFENYDLTFLVHAATEKNRSPLDHWMTEIGVSTQTILNARTGRR
jgi:hypothetical protein